MQAVNDLANIFFRIVLHKSDIGVDRVAAKFSIHVANVLRAGFARRKLGQNIGAVLGWIARRMGAFCQPCH